jgi:DNA modification methylase
MDGGYTLIEGDCRDALRALAAEVSCCVTSPPYWSGDVPPEQYLHHLVETFREVRRVTRAGGSLWLILGDDPRTPVRGIPGMAAQRLEADGWTPHRRIPWIEAADLAHLVLLFTNGPPHEPQRFERIPSGAWQFREEALQTEYRWSVLPEALAAVCVEAGSSEGDTVLDPFCGLASVGAAALKNNRRFIGIDIERRTLQLAWDRLHRVSAALPGLDGTPH